MAERRRIYHNTVTRARWTNNTTRYKLTDADVLVQSLRPEVRERSALEHQVLPAHGHLDASFQYEHEIVDGFALLVDDAGRVGLEPFLVFHFYVEYHVLFQQTHQDRFRHHVRLESFHACVQERKTN